MMLEFVLLCALFAVIELDNVQAFQTMLARPLTAGFLAGVLSGDQAAGIQLGLWTEFLFLDRIPMGGVIPPNGLIAAVSATMMVRYWQLGRPEALIAGVCMGILFPRLDTALRNRRNIWCAEIIRTMEGGTGNIGHWIVRSLAAEAFAAFVFLVVVTFIAGKTVPVIYNAVPEWVRYGVKFAYFAVPWIGLASFTAKFYPKK